MKIKYQACTKTLAYDLTCSNTHGHVISLSLCSLSHGKLVATANKFPFDVRYLHYFSLFNNRKQYLSFSERYLLCNVAIQILLPFGVKHNILEE